MQNLYEHLIIHAASSSVNESKTYKTWKEVPVELLVAKANDVELDLCEPKNAKSIIDAFSDEHKMKVDVDDNFLKRLHGSADLTCDFNKWSKSITN